MKSINIAIFLILLLFLCSVCASVYASNQEASTSSGSGCGNGVIDSGEDCDGANLNGQTCMSRGYVSGTLTCNADCTFNTSNCVSGGGGGGVASSIRDTRVIFRGKAYLDAEITILQDGKIVDVVTTDDEANFKAELSGLTGGFYTFGFWAEDKNGTRSVTFSFTTSITSKMATTVSNIFLPPTIEISKSSLERGEILHILGQTAPQSEITIHIGSLEKIIKKTMADAKGDWDYDFDTNVLGEGPYDVRAKAVSPNNLSSVYSNTLMFMIGGILAQELCPRADLNKDGKTNLIDFSILLYWWGKDNPCADQNQDNKVNLTDFSIMMYNWTG